MLARSYRNGSWSAPIEVTAAGGDLYRPAIAVDGSGRAWVFWSQNEKNNYDLYARPIENVRSPTDPEQNRGATNQRRKRGNGGAIFREILSSMPTIPEPPASCVQDYTERLSLDASYTNHISNAARNATTAPISML